MTFSRPEILFLLWAVLFLGLLFWRAGRRRRGILLEFANERNLKRLTPGQSALRALAKDGLFLCALACLVLALSGARLGYVWEKVEKRGASVMLVLDVSKSMLARDAPPDRLARAKREIRDLLGMLRGEKAGLTAFAGTSFLVCPLTVDYAAFDLFLEALTPDNLPVGGTDLAGAIAAAVSGFEPGEGARKVILLLSDGEGADPKAALQAARDAAKAGARIFCIGLGSAEGAPIPEPGGGFKKDAAKNIVLTRLDDGLLREIAAVAGGLYVPSTPGDEDLTAIYEQGLQDGQGAGKTGESRIQVYRDRFQWFLGAAIFFLALEMFFPAAKSRKAVLRGMLAFCLVGAGTLFFAPQARAGAAAEADKGLSAYAAGDFATARQRFLAAQVREPGSPEAAYDAGCAAYRQGLFEEAQGLFRHAEELAAPKPGQKDAKRALRQQALYNQGNALFRQNALSESVKAYEEAVKLDPEDTEARANLEYVRLQLERRQKDQQDGRNKDQDKDQDKKRDKDQKDQDKNEGGRDSQEDGQKNGQNGQDQSQDGGESQNRDSAGRDQDQKHANDAQPQAQAGNDSGKNKPEEAPASPETGKQPQSRDDGPSRREKAPAGLDETMLNRLKDLPGMPAPSRYGRPQVEKDW